MFVSRSDSSSTFRPPRLCGSWLGAALGVLGFVVSAFAETEEAPALVAIVPRDIVVQSISRTELQDLFLGRSQKLGTSLVRPLHLSARHPIRQRFHEEILKMDLGRYREHWLKSELFGTAQKSQEPRILKNPKSVFLLAKKRNDVIGYAELDETVQALAAEEHFRAVPIVD